MPELESFLQYASTVAFALLGLVSVVGWLRAPSRQRGWIALAFGMLGVVAVLGRVAPAGSPLDGPWVWPVSIAAFQLSGLGLVLLRHSFIRIGWFGWTLALIGLGGSAAAAIYLGQPPPGAIPGNLQGAAISAVVVTWMLSVAEPSVRFWMVSRRLPSVQRRRLQALSLGYLGIVLILLTVFVPAAAQNRWVAIVTAAATLAIAPLLYVAISPPAWLRGVWREEEEEPFRDAVRELLLFSKTRQELAEKALEWVVRIVGAEQGAIIDGDGTVLALHGSSGSALSLAELVEDRPHMDGDFLVEVPGTVSVALPLDNGIGRIIVRAGPYTPVFGGDEILRLRNYGAAVTAALDRVRVSERVAALEEVKSRFLRLASHELRGPLALVKGYVSMAAEGSISGDQLMGMMPVIQARLEQMSAMLSEMLETAQLEDDRLELKPSYFDMRQAVESVASALRPLAGDTHPIEVALPMREVPVVADRGRVEAIVTNLIDNAIKYSPGGGRIDCTVGIRGGDALVEVRDHGIGIAQEDMDKLFTRFGRIVTDTTAAIPGTGLGLYLARELARMHQGELTANSKAGEGSSFTLRLPLARAHT